MDEAMKLNSKLFTTPIGGLIMKMPDITMVSRGKYMPINL